MAYGLKTDVLWDTGSQVSIISHSWLKQCLPECDSWAKFLCMNGLELKAANGTDLPCVGCMKLTFNFIKDDSDHTVTDERRNVETLVHFITSEPLEEPEYTEDRENTVVFVSHLSPEEHA